MAYLDVRCAWTVPTYQGRQNKPERNNETATWDHLTLPQTCRQRLYKQQ